MLKNILFISAHADDAILAAGGTIKYYLDQKENVYYLSLSIAEDSVPTGFDKTIVETECKEAITLLGIPKKNAIFEHFPVRQFPKYRQEVLDLLINVRKTIIPDIVFTPSTQDVHQDHKVVCDETIRAFMKFSSIYGYDFPWNFLYEGRQNLYYELNDFYLQQKILACQCFKSQLVKSNNCLTPDYLKSLAIERGNRVNRKYAESYELIREIRSIKL